LEKNATRKTEKKVRKWKYNTKVDVGKVNSKKRIGWDLSRIVTNGGLWY
jgi:hypothetical protein